MMNSLPTFLNKLRGGEPPVKSTMPSNIMPAIAGKIPTRGRVLDLHMFKLGVGDRWHERRVIVTSQYLYFSRVAEHNITDSIPLHEIQEIVYTSLDGRVMIVTMPGGYNSGRPYVLMTHEKGNFQQQQIQSNGASFVIQSLTQHNSSLDHGEDEEDGGSTFASILKQLVSTAKKALKKKSRWQRLHKWASKFLAHPVMRITTVLAIVLNFINSAISKPGLILVEGGGADYVEDSGVLSWDGEEYGIIESCFTAFFTVEFFINSIAYYPFRLHIHFWIIFDALIVLSSIVEVILFWIGNTHHGRIGFGLTYFLILRPFRLFRVFGRVGALKCERAGTVDHKFTTLNDPLLNISALIVCTVACYSVAGVHMFWTIGPVGDHGHVVGDFSSFEASMFTMVVTATGNRWGELSQECKARIKNPSLVSLFFVSYVLIMLLVLLPGFIGLCMDRIVRAGNKWRLENIQAKNVAPLDPLMQYFAHFTSGQDFQSMVSMVYRSLNDDEGHEITYDDMYVGLKKLDIGKGIHLSREDFDAITCYGQLCNDRGSLGPSEFEVIMRLQLREYVERHSAAAFRALTDDGQVNDGMATMLMCMRILLFDNGGGFSSADDEDDDESREPSVSSSPYPSIDINRMSLWREKMKSTYSAAMNQRAQIARSPGRVYGSGDSDDRMMGYARSTALQRHRGDELKNADGDVRNDSADARKKEELAVWPLWMGRDGKERKRKDSLSGLLNPKGIISGVRRLSAAWGVRSASPRPGSDSEGQRVRPASGTSVVPADLATDSSFRSAGSTKSSPAPDGVKSILKRGGSHRDRPSRSPPSSPIGASGSQSRGHQLRKTASMLSASSQLSGAVLETIMDTSERGWGESHNVTRGSSSRSRSPRRTPGNDGQEGHLQQIPSHIAMRPEIVQQKYFSHGEQGDISRFRASQVTPSESNARRRGSLAGVKTFTEMNRDGAILKSLEREGSSDLSEDMVMSPTRKGQPMTINIANSETGSSREADEGGLRSSVESMSSVGEDGYQGRRTDNGGVGGSAAGSGSGVRHRLLDPQKESELNGIESDHVGGEGKTGNVQLDGYAFQEDATDRGAGGGEGGVTSFFLETIYSDDGKSVHDHSPISSDYRPAEVAARSREDLSPTFKNLSLSSSLEDTSTLDNSGDRDMTWKLKPADGNSMGNPGSNPKIDRSGLEFDSMSLWTNRSSTRDGSNSNNDLLSSHGKSRGASLDRSGLMSLQTSRRSLPCLSSASMSEADNDEARPRIKLMSPKPGMDKVVSEKTRMLFEECDRLLNEGQ